MIDTNELTSRIYDELFDMVGFSEHHVNLEHNINIVRQDVEGNVITIELGNGDVYECTVNKVD